MCKCADAGFMLASGVNDSGMYPDIQGHLYHPINRSNPCFVDVSLQTCTHVASDKHHDPNVQICQGAVFVI